MEKSAAGCGTVVGEPAHGALGGGGEGNGGSKGSGQKGPGKTRSKKNPKPPAGASKRGPGEGRSDQAQRPSAGAAGDGGGRSRKTPLSRTRLLSGKIVLSRIMHITMAGMIVRTRFSLSNFRCMK